VARPGYSRIAVAALLTVAAWIGLPGLWRTVLGGLLLVLLVLLVNFYRDPERHPPETARPCVLAPADGRIVAVDDAGPRLCISIFLSAFDVHVNRAPVTGLVRELVHTRGRYLPAFMARSSSENERVRLVIESPEAGDVVCTQVAGLLARRIDNWIEVGHQLTQGDRFGMIHLGSRVDLEIRGDFVPAVSKGQHVRAGQSVLAKKAHD
jgi:phosphatidylserine decarboxylase